MYCIAKHVVKMENIINTYWNLEGNYFERRFGWRTNTELLRDIKIFLSEMVYKVHGSSSESFSVTGFGTVIEDLGFSLGYIQLP